MRRQRVPIRNEEKALIFLLEFQPIRKRAEIMAQMKPPGGAHAGKNSFAFLQPSGLLRRAADRARSRCVAFRLSPRKSSARARRDNSAPRHSRANIQRCRGL